MFNLDIHTNLKLDLIINDNLKNNNKTTRHIDEIILNHNLFFYIKDKKINNRIIFCGLINY